MSGVTIIEFALLHGLLIATVSGSIGMNYRKNEVFNLGLAGLAYLGSTFSLILAEIMNTSLYWSIPFSILFGSLLTIGLNYMFIRIRQANSNKNMMVGATISSCIGLIIISDLVYTLVKNMVNPVSTGIIQDFTVFNLPGGIVLSPVIFVFSLLLQFILSPIVEERETNPFDKWDLLVYSLTGSFACLIGSFYPLWSDVLSPSVMVQVIIAGALLGGVDKKLNPYIGGFLSGYIWLFFPLASNIFGASAMAYSHVLPIVLGLISIPLFPKGLIGKIRSLIDYSY